MKDSIYLFQWFTEKGCKVSREKLQLSLGPINYLGHDLRAEGIWLPPKRVKWNQEFPRTTTKWQLCVFLGLAGYCRLLFHTFLYYKWAGLYKTKWSTARTTCPRAPKLFTLFLQERDDPPWEPSCGHRAMNSGHCSGQHAPDALLMPVLAVLGLELWG